MLDLASQRTLILVGCVSCGSQVQVVSRLGWFVQIQSLCTPRSRLPEMPCIPPTSCVPPSHVLLAADI